MDIFGRKTKQLQQKIEIMEGSIRQSFSKVRQDMDNTAAWLNYYYQKSLYFESMLNQSPAISQNLNSKVTEISKSSEKHSKMISELTDNLSRIFQQFASLQSITKKNVPEDRLNFHIENISKELRLIGQKVERLSYIPSRVEALKEEIENHLSSPHISTEVERRLDELQQKLRDIVVKKSPKEKLIQKVAKNSHDYIKAMVLSYIKKYGKITGCQLREMIVEEQNLASKSTFYRILEEIEESDEVSTIRQGKEKIYLSKLKKTA